MRDSYNGITPAFQADDESSILLSRSKFQFRASVTVAQQTPNLLDGVQFPGSEPNNSKVANNIGMAECLGRSLQNFLDWLNSSYQFHFF